MEYFFGLFDIDPSADIHLEFEDVYEKKDANLSGFCHWALVRCISCSVFPEAADSDSACVSSIIRLVYSVQLAQEVDTTYTIGKVAMWRYIPDEPFFHHHYYPAKVLKVAPK